MRRIDDYQLFLFDFDGLLVNTEEIHFLAYQKMCADRGFILDWDFSRYCQHAHYDSEALRKGIYAYFPDLHKLEPDWKVLYAEKQKAVKELLKAGAIHLMPGVERLLRFLDQVQIPRCVVTHSSDELVSIVREQNPILDSIPFWFTREHYSNPKPHPECYLKAIDKLAKKDDRIIGFEDTPRGLNALLETPAQPVLICQVQYPEIPGFLKQGAFHLPSFEDLSLPK